MTRHSKRMEVKLPATVTVEGTERAFKCKTLDISENGLFLETTESLEMSQELFISLPDLDTGGQIEVWGTVVRIDHGEPVHGVGIRVFPPIPTAWGGLVELHQALNFDPVTASQAMRVLVVKDSPSGGELAFYATSGWRVEFAMDLDDARTKMNDPDLAVVIAEFSSDDVRWREVLDDVRVRSPGVRRILRTSIEATDTTPDGFAAEALIALSVMPSGPHKIADREATDPGAGPLAADPLIHALVDTTHGLEALVDAIMASFAEDY